ncbi:hypothetical protein ACFX2F_009180 [Malus domestica]
MWKKERNTNMWKMKMKRIKKKKMEMKKNMKREKKTKRVDEGKMGKVEGSSGKEVMRGVEDEGLNQFLCTIE